MRLPPSLLAFKTMVNASILIISLLKEKKENKNGENKNKKRRRDKQKTQLKESTNNGNNGFCWVASCRIVIRQRDRGIWNYKMEKSFRQHIPH